MPQQQLTNTHNFTSHQQTSCHAQLTRTTAKPLWQCKPCPAAPSTTHLCTKLELVQAPANLVQVLVLLLRLSLNLSRLLAIANLMQALCADTRVRAAAWLAHGMLLLLLVVVPAVLLLHGLVVGLVAGSSTAGNIFVQSAEVMSVLGDKSSGLQVRGKPGT